MKLTKAQWTTLVDADADERGFSCIETYPPAVKLIALGLVDARSVGIGTVRITPTGKGRDVIKAGGKLSETSK
jgi:hypothetical protein